VTAGPPNEPAGDPFARRWRQRFESFASARDDDAGIAGWSTSGLETRFRFFRRLFPAPPPGTSWLDVGCGAGTYSAWLEAHGARVTGLDYSLATLAKARVRLPASVALCAGDATRLPFRDGAFDGALCFGVLQAVSATPAVVQELARVLRPGGSVWIDVLNASALHARAREWQRRRAGKPPHLRYESARILRDALGAAGFVDVATSWLPIAPARIRRVQPLLESAPALASLATVPGLGPLLAHSVLAHATKAA
jgi:SAM-dependent methyltransferase